MPSPTLDILPDGALVVEADTTEEALTQVGQRLGHDAEITEARRIHRGGWKGFFAHEAVQLTARPRSDAPHSADLDSEKAPAASPWSPWNATGTSSDVDGVTSALARMTRLVDDQELSFRDVLVGHLGSEVPVGEESSAAAAPAPTVSTATPPSAVPPAPRSHAPATGSPSRADWQLDHLRDMRLPNALVDACHGLDRADDAGWVSAISAAVATWCRPLPTGDAVLVGPRAHRLAKALAMPVAQQGDVVARSGPVGLKAMDSDPQRVWVEQVAGDRWRHVVAGGRGWHGFLFDDALAVSWVGDEALPGALCVAGRLGLVLGYGLGSATGRAAVRANPVDVALVIRSLLPPKLG